MNPPLKFVAIAFSDYGGIGFEFYSTGHRQLVKAEVGTTHLEMQWAREHHLLQRMASLEKQQKSQSVVPHQRP
jgi:hypothetical protein